MNDYTTPGTYYFNDIGTVDRHFPLSASGKLIVENRINSNNYKRQTFYCGTISFGVFEREINSGNTFGNWIKIR